MRSRLILDNLYFPHRFGIHAEFGWTEKDEAMEVDRTHDPSRSFEVTCLCLSEAESQIWFFDCG